MNLFLWVLQIALAFLCLSGGAYKAFKFDELARQMRSLSRGAWRVLGVFEVVCGVLLIVPVALKWMPSLTPLAAAALALECLFLCAIYAKTSLKPTPANPLVWSVVMALMAAFVAYGRYSPSLSA